MVSEHNVSTPSLDLDQRDALSATPKGMRITIDHVQGKDFPSDLSSYDLVIHCGACMFSRRAMLSRIQACERAGVPIANYGMVLAHFAGIAERALAPFNLELIEQQRG